MKNKALTFVDKVIDFFSIITFIILIFFGSYAIYDSYHITSDAKLSDDILKIKPKETETSFSLKQLQNINKDIIGWIKINDTVIDYPLLKGTDNSQYLDIDYKGDFSTAGSIFLDYRNDNLKDDYSVIYGHNMSSGLMFADIKKFANADFFKSHKTGKLYTDGVTYDILIYSYAIINAYSSEAYNIPIYKNGQNSSMINYFKQNSIFKSDFEIKPEDKLMLLSTCDSNSKTDRDVLLVKLVKSDEKDEEVHKIKEKEKEEVKNIKQEKVNNTSNVSIKDILFIVLFIIVIIIFIIFFINIIRSKTNNKK